MEEIIIIGGGASGLLTAVLLAEKGLQPLVLERLDRVGKKLLATGNGRCNLMNEGVPAFAHGGDFAAAVLEGVSAEAQRRLWERLGLRLRADSAGRVYPVSNAATSVLDVLRLHLARLGVRVETGCAAEAVRTVQGGFSVRTPAGEKRCRRLVVAGGGMAQAKLGSDGSALQLLASLGHRVTPCLPGLCGLKTDKRPIAGLAGIRAAATVSVPGYEETGELLFAEDGVSGICVMNCASHLPETGGMLHISFLPALGFDSAETLAAELFSRKHALQALPLEQLLTGLCVPRLASVLCRMAGIRWQDRTVGSMSGAEVKRLAAAAADFSLQATALRGFDQAQVTRGGVALSEVDPKTLRSRKLPGLYILGESLDVDGLCGGNNLMFAFGTAMRCAEAMEV